MSRSSNARSLRRRIDHDDSFTAGHQIITIRRTKRSDPEWTKSDETVKEMLLRSFPRLDSDSLQRDRAGRWARVVYLYYRQHHTTGQIAEELEISYESAKGLIRAIQRASRGRRADGTGINKGIGHRPKKNLEVM